MADDTSSFFGAAVPAVKFERVGESVTGRVMAKELRQQTDLDTGDLQYWKDGRPMMMALLTLQVEDPTDEDDGKRILYVRSGLTTAFREAVKAAGKSDLYEGDYVTVEYTGDGVAPRKGLNPPKQFAVKIMDETPF